VLRRAIIRRHTGADSRDRGARRDHPLSFVQ